MDDLIAHIRKGDQVDGKITLYAHSLAGRPQSEWQTLREHSCNVAEVAARFAQPFKSGDWARILGWLHDLGKARPSFQAYLAKENGIEDDREYDGSDHSHSGAGAIWAVGKYGVVGRIFGYVVAGHHAGLPDWIGGETPNGALDTRLQEEANVMGEAGMEEFAAKTCMFPDRLPPPPFAFTNDKARGIPFWIRMLYSALVDADFLDTEAFMDKDRAEERGGYPTLSELSERFFAEYDRLRDASEKTELNQTRAAIRNACETAAMESPGLFSLTVPTGGGKTLAAMAFAFRHALKHGKRRIIYVIPYTSIIEQTADVLRRYLGEGNVLEHHSNFDPDKETMRSRLASENWDAPIIVTTSVQFFESLYACKSSRCRKLHNIAESVVIVDEAQLLPTKLLKPCVWAIQELAEHYGTTFVLSTATQPNLPGLDNVREIIPADLRLYETLRRTEWTLPDRDAPRQSWEEIAAELAQYEQVLCVVNTRRDCRDLYEKMPRGTIHLSASMCGEHRSRVIRRIKEMLGNGEPVRVISTQLVEAGVDIDFPIVYRAFTGLSSIAQAAGRCNREGKLDGLGKVVVFYPPQESPQGELRNGEYAMRDMLVEDCTDFQTSEVYPRYFEKLQARAHTLGEGLDQYLGRNAREWQFQFREAAAAFKMIDEMSVPVVVRYGEGIDAAIESIRKIGPKRQIMRKLQRHTVNVPLQTLKRMVDAGLVEVLAPGVYAQSNISLYSDELGLDFKREGLTVEECIYS